MSHEASPMQLVNHDLTKSPSGSPFSDPRLPMGIDLERPSLGPLLNLSALEKKLQSSSMRNEELEELGELRRRTTGQTKGNSIQSHSFKRAFFVFVSFIDVSPLFFKVIWNVDGADG